MAFRPSQEGMLISSQGYQLLGTLFTAEGDEPKPTAIVLHGIPGIEKNYDLAHTLRDNGWNAIIFHYRGSWGSAGTYSIPDIPGDVSAVIDELQSRHPIVDPQKIAVIGHSLGGWAAVLAAARDRRVRALCLIGGVLENERSKFSDPEYAAYYTPWLTGITPEDLARQWSSLRPDDDPIQVAHKLACVPILILHGDLDAAIDKSHSLNFSSALNCPHEIEIVPDADHSFIWRRPWLRERVMAWCKQIEWENDGNPTGQP